MEQHSTEQNSGNVTISQLTSAPRNSFEGNTQAHLEWVSDQVAMLFLILGYGLTAERQVLFAQALTDIPRERLETGFTQAAKELTYEPRPADVRKLAGALAEQMDLGEADRAWEISCGFADKFIVSDDEGIFKTSQGVRSEPMPRLSQRILDVVKRTGGWGPYKWRTEKSIPFLHRDFLQEYKVWVHAQNVDESKMLTPGEALKQLPGSEKKLALMAKPMEPRTERATMVARMTPPMEQWTPEELNSRREAAKADLLAWRDRRAK